MKVLFFAVTLFCCGVLQLFGQTALPDLKNIDDLQKQFTADAGKVRMIALLSPT
jgi:hypothetical protein